MRFAMHFSLRLTGLLSTNDDVAVENLPEASACRPHFSLYHSTTRSLETCARQIVEMGMAIAHFLGWFQLTSDTSQKEDDDRISAPAPH